MIVAVTFRAKIGMEDQFNSLLNDPETGRRFAELMGATRNILFLGNGIMVRVMEFPDGVTPRTLTDIAKENIEVASFLRKLGRVIDGGFDYDQPKTLDDFSKKVTVPLAYDVRVQGR
jgi:hypothetical protein